MKDKISKISGISFQLKDFRSTLATMLVDGDETRMKAVSMQLRHESIKTTEQFYARIDKSTVRRIRRCLKGQLL
jgi:integrase